MPTSVITISLPLPMRMGFVNCYLIGIDSNFILIDCGGSNSRRILLEELEKAGCQPGKLGLVVLTHGDFDHSGNAAHLRGKFGCKVAMHPSDFGMVEAADMFVNRKKPNILIRRLIPLFTGFGKGEKFSPDLPLQDGDSLSEYGFPARVFSIPGHSKGSIGILTDDGAFFCGDLMENLNEPGLNAIMDDLEGGIASLERVLGLPVKLVYPGHGQPFRLEQVKRG